MAIFKQERAGRCLPCPTRSHSIKCVFSGSTQESASFVPRDRFFSERMEESLQIITLNYILIAADFPAQLRIFTLQFCRTKLAVDRLIIRNFLFQTINLSLELCNQIVCRIHRLLQFGFLFLCCIIFLIAISPCVSVVLSVFLSAAFAEHRSRFCRPAHPACPLLCAIPNFPFSA